MDIQENKDQNAGQGAGTVKAVGVFIWDLLKIFIIALVIIIPFRMFVAEPFVVSGSSMVPNFHNGDYLIIDRLSYHFSTPSRGDAIVLLFPKDTSQFFIKRIIGLPGETICLHQGHVIVSQTVLTSAQCQESQGPYLDEPYIPAGVETNGSPLAVTLGSDEYFVLGDNRTASSDSRVWGILPKADIVGRVWARVFPLNAATVFKTPSYQ
jgi:signal peptidase I